MEDKFLKRSVRFAKSNMDWIYFQDVLRNSVVILLILLHFQVSFNVIFPQLQLCHLHCLVYRDIDEPAFSEAVGFTLLPKHRRCCNWITLESGWCQPGKRRAKSCASVPAISQAPVTRGTLRYVFLVCLSHGHCHNYNMPCILRLEDT